LIEGAKREGEVSWYSTLTLDMSTQLLERFKKKYPFIKKTPLYVGSGTPVLNKILTEDRGGLHAWDVLQGNAEMVPPLMEKKLLVSYRSPETKMIDDDLVDKRGYWSSIYLLSYVLGWNTNLVKKEDVPKTYEALLDSKWKGGKISMDSEAYAMFKGLIKAWGKDKAVSYLKSLAAMDPILKRGSTARATLLVAGEYPLVVAFNQTMQRMLSKGASVDWVALEPAVVVLDLIAVAAKAPHPNAARLFYDFLI
jgi:iron(III) transport system substrate-binding protein